MMPALCGKPKEFGVGFCVSYTQGIPFFYSFFSSHLLLVPFLVFFLQFSLAQEHRHFCTKLKEKLGPEAAQEKIDKEREKFYLKMASMSKFLYFYIYRSFTIAN